MNFKKNASITSVFILCALIFSNPISFPNAAETKTTATTEKKKKEEKPKEAPEFPRKSIWVNSEPLTLKVYEDKLTLVYFWDYTSVNCIRELHFLKKWFDRYQPYGFSMIFIHAPEFDFAIRKSSIVHAAERLQIPYPILLDNQFKVWEGFGAYSWPTRSLVNEKAEIISSQVGEGHYLEMEEKIRQELKRLNPGIVLPQPVTEKEDADAEQKDCGVMTAETYIGYNKANWWGGRISNKQYVGPGETVLLKDRGDRVERGFFAEGLWRNGEQYFEHARDTEKLTDFLGLIYLAREVYVVMSYASGAGATRIYVTRDDKPVPAEQRGVDLREDPSGGTYFLMQQPRLYYLIANEDQTAHELKVWTTAHAVAVHSFSFANRCLNDFDHL